MNEFAPAARHATATVLRRRTFHDGVRLQDLLLYPRVLAADGGEELQDQLRALRLPSSRLATDTQHRGTWNSGGRGTNGTIGPAYDRA